MHITTLIRSFTVPQPLLPSRPPKIQHLEGPAGTGKQSTRLMYPQLGHLETCPPQTVVEREEEVGESQMRRVEKDPMTVPLNITVE